TTAPRARRRRRARRRAAHAGADRARLRSRRGAGEAARQHGLHASLPEEDDARIRRACARVPGGARPGRLAGGGGRVTTLGERIKGLRAERELQQRQLAEKADLTPSMVSQIESGRLTPSLHTLGRIAAALGVPIGALFDGQPAGSIVVTRRKGYPVVSFDGSRERWAGLGAVPLHGNVRGGAVTLRITEGAG